MLKAIRANASEQVFWGWGPLQNVLWIAVGLVGGSSLPGLASTDAPVTVRDRCFLPDSPELSAMACTPATKSDKPLPSLQGEMASSQPLNMEFGDWLNSIPHGPAKHELRLADMPASAGSTQTVEVDPAIIESSPVLQRWLKDVPDVSVDIQHDPAFRTRVRVGYSQFPSTDDASGFYVGIQDVFVGRTPLTLSAEYSTDGEGDRELLGADAQYYLLPLGWYGNVAPVLGYRSINNSTFESAGVNVGFRIILVPSRTGAADLSLTQSWVSPGTEDEVGLTTFSVGYAIAEDFRIGTDIQTQNTRDRQESRVSLLLEWML